MVMDKKLSWEEQRGNARFRWQAEPSNTKLGCLYLRIERIDEGNRAPAMEFQIDSYLASGIRYVLDNFYPTKL